MLQLRWFFVLLSVGWDPGTSRYPSMSMVWLGAGPMLNVSSWRAGGWHETYMSLWNGCNCSLDHGQHDSLPNLVSTHGINGIDHALWGVGKEALNPGRPWSCSWWPRSLIVDMDTGELAVVENKCREGQWMWDPGFYSPGALLVCLQALVLFA